MSWGDWANIRGTVAAFGGALGPVQVVGGSVSYINDIYAQGGGTVSVNETHQTQFQQGIRGRINANNTVSVDVHVLASAIPPSNNNGEENRYTWENSRTWSIYPSFSTVVTDDENTILESEWVNSPTTMVQLQTVPAYVPVLSGNTIPGVGLFSNSNPSWNAPGATVSQRAWLRAGENQQITVPLGMENWTWFRGFLSTQHEEEIRGVPFYLTRAFFPDLYRPMATRLGHTWHSLDTEGGFLKTRGPSGWTDMPLLSQENIGTVNGSSRSRSGNQWIQQNLIPQAVATNENSTN